MFKKDVNGYVLIAISLLALLILSSAINTEKVYALSGEIKGGPPLTDTFTYQGYFEYSGSPANGNFDFRITIWDLQTLGTQIASCQAFDNILIQDGLFTFHLIPNAGMSETFNGDGRWLQVEVRQTGTTTWYTLPRQPITAVPYAWSLRPGAVIEGSTANTILRLDNSGEGGALYADSSRITGVTISAHHSSDGYAMLGTTGGGYPAVGGVNGGAGNGLYGTSETGIGVYGRTNSTSSSGVIGIQTGYLTSDFSGYWNPGGFFGGRNGVIGVTKEVGGYGVFGVAKADNSFGISGLNNATSGYAGYFYSSITNGVYIYSPIGTTALSVAGGTKNAVVETDEGSTLLYSEESTEVWFTDYGFGTINDHFVQIIIDPLFAQTVNLEEPYHVFLQAYGDTVLYVTNRTPHSFDVHISEGALPVDFSYRIVARRLGYENARLELFEDFSSETKGALQQPIIEGE